MKTVQLFLPNNSSSKSTKDSQGKTNQKNGNGKRNSDKMSALSKADTSVDEIAPSSQFASLIEPSGLKDSVMSLKVCCFFMINCLGT
jgi:hypothetical protein